MQRYGLCYKLVNVNNMETFLGKYNRCQHQTDGGLRIIWQRCYSSHHFLKECFHEQLGIPLK